MPFYIRKSVSVGPFRFNLSKGGIGVSAGIRGLRIGTGPRGHYIHAGRGGIYYRSSLGKRTAAPGAQARVAPPPVQPAPASYAEPNVTMVRVSSSDVLQMEDARFTEILAELTQKQASMSMTTVLGWIGGAVTLLSLLTAGAGGLLIGLIFTGLAMLAGAWVDSHQRSSVLMYDLEDEARAAYERVTASFDGLLACSGKWHVDAGGAVQDIHTWKRNAGAAHILDKRPTDFGYALPRVVKSNITPPMIRSGKEALYFMPDFLLVVDCHKVGAVAYDKLAIRWEDANFIENATVPTDAEVLFYTWKHPNKSGGPDRRFADNYQIPVCRYESIYISSSNGLNELLQISRSGVTAPFAASLANLARTNGASAAQGALPAL